METLVKTVPIPGQEVPSEQQAAVASWVETGLPGECLNLEARAGCGKTSTLLQILPKTKGQTILLAYNKAIAEEIKSRLIKAKTPYRISAQTVHALGLSSWRRIVPKIIVDGDKVRGIIKKLSKKDDDFYIRNISQIYKLVSLAKQSAFGYIIQIDNQEAWLELVEHYCLDDDLADKDTVGELVKVAIEVFNVSIALDREVIDFDDMILAPLVHNSTVDFKDWILLDEAQDTNAARRALALKCLRPGTGRLIAVGDPFQAIYGFAGANSDAMDLIKTELNSHTLYLTVTYRCPKAVVREANKIVPDLVAHESAPEGIVRSLAVFDAKNQPWFLKTPPEKTSAILCRNTKPLIEHAYLFLANGIGCKVEGRDIGEGLVSLAKRWRGVTTTHQLSQKLQDYKLKEVQKWLAKGKEDRAQSVEDRVGALLAVINRVNGQGKYGIEDVVASIRSLFDDTVGKVPQVVTLSTIHKSKGREWNTVYLLDRAGTLPSRYAKQEWQLQQEANLEYVAITRSKNELVDLIMPAKRS